MGSPTRWLHPDYGICLSLWAAIAELQAQGATAVPGDDRQTIRCQFPGEAATVIEAIHYPAAGWIFPLRRLEAADPRS